MRVNERGTTVVEKSTKVEEEALHHTVNSVNSESDFNSDVNKSCVLARKTYDMYLHLGNISPQHTRFPNTVCKDIQPVTPLLYQDVSDSYQDIFDSFQEVETEEPIHDYETEFVVSEISHILSRKHTDPRAAGYRLAEDTYTVGFLEE